MKRMNPTLVLVALLCAGGCDDPASSPLTPPADDVGSLSFLGPSLDGFDPRVVEVDRDSDAAGAGPLAIDVNDLELDVPVTIWNAQTTLVFEQGAILATGFHSYTGNVGQVVTTVHASVNNMDLGQQTAERLQNHNMLLDFGAGHFIYVGARIYTSEPCGISATAWSAHRAWWELQHGNGVMSWGRVSLPTQATPKSWNCGQTERTRDEDSTGGISGTRYQYCTYLITYDLDTGQIYDTQLLYCSAGSDDALL